MLLLQTTSNIYIVKISAVFRPLKINTIIKRTMLRSKLSLTMKLLPTMQNVPHNGNILSRPATYRVDDAHVLTTTHEQSQSNPLLQRNNGSTFQHPPYVRVLCDLDHCKDVICPKPCSRVIETADVGHATHSPTYPMVKYISAIDSKGEIRPEYMVSYNPPIENTTSGCNINQDKTRQLNSNTEALNNVHMNSSREPTIKASQGSNDLTNIN